MTLADRRGVDMDVYEPAEDSWLLAMTVVEYVSRDDRVLDVGTGSGYIADVISQETGAWVVGTDINPCACALANRNGVPAVRCNLVEAVVTGGFDVVVFNPPYLPIARRGRRDWFSVAVAGGESGRVVVTSFLERVGRVLTPNGIVFLLVSSLTGVSEVVAVATDRGFHAETVREEAYPGEELIVLSLKKLP